MEIMVWLKFLRNVHFVVLQAFIEGLEGWLSLSKMQTDFRSSKSVLHQLDQKIIYPHYDFKHLTEKYFEIGMKLRNG